MNRPRPGKSLNSKQLHLLRLIYKFRFVTVEMLNKSGNRNQADVLRRRLNLLTNQGYIYRKYDSSYRLQNKPAEYCLDTGGINALRKENASSRALNAAYKDRNANPGFIEHNFNILRLYKKFRQLYPGINFATKSELHHADNLPKNLPDALISFKSLLFFMDVIDQPAQLISFKKRLLSYLDFFEDEYDRVGNEPPRLLVACSEPRLEARAQKLARRYSEDEFDVLTTSLKALLESHPDSKVWADIGYPEKLVKIFGS